MLVAIKLHFGINFLSIFYYYTPQLRAHFNNHEQDEYAAAGSLAEEAISAIKTVVTFGGEEKEANR